MDFLWHKLVEIFVSLVFLYWLLKASLMVVGIRIDFWKVLLSFKNKEKKR